MSGNPIQEDIKGYIQNLRSVKKRTPLTVGHYEAYLQRFVSFMNITRVSGISMTTIESFKKKLQEQDVSPTTINYHLIAVRNFLRSMPESHQRLNYKDIQLYHPERSNTPKPISIPIKKILEIIDGSVSRDAIINLRDTALLLLILYTPLSILQMSTLRKTEYRKNALTLKDTKKNVLKVSIPKQVSNAIDEYLLERTDDSPYLFVGHDRADQSRKSKPLSFRSIQRIIIRSGKLAGYEITARSLKQLRTL